jgi:uncharacterized membrane protein YfcA
MNAGEVLLVAGAGFLCGLVNAIAGGGSLILFPAMVATGMGTLAANVTNAVSTWPGYLGSAYGFRAELAEQRHRAPRLVVAAAAGALAGAVLLLVTPTDAFDALVPFLVLAAGAMIAIQPAIARRVGEPVEGARRHRWMQVGAVFAASIYGGYFGAALGVVYLGVLALTIAAPLRKLNGLKAAMSVAGATVGVVVFGLFGPVEWWAVAAAAPSALVGGYVGSHLSRRVDERVLRTSIVVLSMIVAVALFVG